MMISDELSWFENLISVGTPDSGAPSSFQPSRGTRRKERQRSRRHREQLDAVARLHRLRADHDLCRREHRRSPMSAAPSLPVDASAPGVASAGDATGVGVSLGSGVGVSGRTASAPRRLDDGIAEYRICSEDGLHPSSIRRRLRSAGPARPARPAVAARALPAASRSPAASRAASSASQPPSLASSIERLRLLDEPVQHARADDLAALRQLLDLADALLGDVQLHVALRVVAERQREAHALGLQLDRVLPVARQRRAGRSDGVRRTRRAARRPRPCRRRARGTANRTAGTRRGARCAARSRRASCAAPPSGSACAPRRRTSATARCPSLLAGAGRSRRGSARAPPRRTPRAAARRTRAPSSIAASSSGRSSAACSGLRRRHSSRSQRPSTQGLQALVQPCLELRHSSRIVRCPVRCRDQHLLQLRHSLMLQRLDVPFALAQRLRRIGDRKPRPRTAARSPRAGHPAAAPMPAALPRS